MSEGSVLFILTSMSVKLLRVFGAIVFVAINLRPDCLAHNPSSEDGEGFLVIRSSVDSFFVMVDSRIDAAHLAASGDTLALSAGSRRIVIAPRAFPSNAFTVNIEPGVVVTRIVAFEGRRSQPSEGSLHRTLTVGGNLQVSADPDARLVVNGTDVVRGSAVLRLPPGVYNIASHTEARSRRVRVKVDDYRYQGIALFTRPKRLAVRTAAMIPAGGHFAKREYEKAAVIAGSVSALAIYAAVQESRFQNHQDATIRAASLYERARTEERAQELGVIMARHHREAIRAASRRDRGLIAAAVIYALSVADGMRAPRGGFRAMPELQALPVIDAASAGVTITYEF